MVENGGGKYSSGERTSGHDGSGFVHLRVLSYVNVTHGIVELRLSSFLRTSESSPLASLKCYMSALPTQTATNNAVQMLIRLLLLNTAASRQASHLLLGTSLTSLSVNLISGIAQGSGFTIVGEAQEEWAPHPPRGISIRIIRPMRDIGMKDCAIWNWWFGLHPMPRPSHNLDGGRNAIDALTRGLLSHNLHSYNVLSSP